MLDRLAETFIAGVELLEAEGRVARDQAAGLASGAVQLAVCGSVGLLGVLAATIGVTWLLADAIGMGGALAIVGTFIAAASGVCGLLVNKRLQGSSDESSEDPTEDPSLDRFLDPPE